MKEAKYEIVRKDILARILSGQFPDKRLPSIKQLAECYDVSLMTANRAVKLLEETGIVQCCPGNVGTVIDEQKAASMCLQGDARHIWTDKNMFIEERVKIRYLCQDYTSKNHIFWNELIKLFTARYPWIDVEIQTCNNMADSLSSNLEYDVLRLSGRDLYSHQRHNHLMDITELVTEHIAHKSLFPKSLCHCKVADAFWGLPSGISTPIVFYNKKKCTNIVDDLTWDWQSFLSSVKNTITRGGYSAINMGIASLLPYFVGDIHKLTEDNVDKAALKELIHVLKYITLGAPSDKALEPTNVINEFLNEKISFFCAYTFYIKEISEKSNFEWGILPMPKKNNGESAMEIILNGINPRCRHKKEAWLFIKFLCSQKAQTVFARDGLHIPVDNTVFEDAYLNQHPLDKEVIRNIIKTATPNSISSQTLYTMYRCIHPVLENHYNTHGQVEDTIEEMIKYIREMLLLEYLE